MIKIYNSLTNKKEEFKPIKEGELSMYVCGPTVYNYMHIGNSRPTIFFDTVSRFFKYLGYKVTFVSNFTDIDDKIIKRAKEEGVTEKEISEKFIKEIKDTYRRLNCLPHDYNPQVTQTMPEIIDFVKLLVDKGGAYVVDGDVYFDVPKIKNYGVLSGQTVEKLISGARIDVSDKKHNPCDFALWKKTDEGIKWDSPFGEGRPGWHTECVVMIHKIFGGMIDIHGGGLDLKFPHHDNEIAQQECAYDNTIANYWMHNGRVDFKGEKMSKSLGNVVWANDLLDQIPVQVYRLLFLNVPYRQPLNYTDDLIAGAQGNYEKIKRLYISLYRTLELANALDEANNIKEFTSPEVEAIRQKFIAYMSDDFNTANAISAIFEAIKLANNKLHSSKATLVEKEEVFKVIKDMLWVLGVEIPVTPLTEEEKALQPAWIEARNNKDYAKADELRAKLEALGII